MIDSKVGNRDNKTTFMISYVVTVADECYKDFNAVELPFFKSLKVHIQLALHLCDPF